MKKDLTSYDDEELLMQYRYSHNSVFLTELYERYVILVYGVALKYLKNIPDAQDAVMQIWEELFDKVLVHDIHNFKGWLYTCVRNHCLMELRKSRGNVRVQLDERVMEFCDDFHLDDIRRKEKSGEALEECLENLPEKQHLCVRHFFMEELSYKEIVAISGFSLKMVKSFIQNGKRNLRLCLEKKGIC